MKIIVPIYLKIPRKTKKDKSISLNMWWYRNVNFIVNNNCKKLFKELIKDQLNFKIEWQVQIHYKLYWKIKSDLDNRQWVITKYFQDALVECWCIIDDNVEYIVENRYRAIAKDKDNPRMEIEIIRE